MTIGRTEDPGNPKLATAFEAASLFGLDRGTHLGQRTEVRANRPDTCTPSTTVTLIFLLHPRGRPHMRRKPRKLVAVALANKMARTIWALLARGGVYRAPAPAA